MCYIESQTTINDSQCLDLLPSSLSFTHLEIQKDSLTNMSFSKLRKASGRWWGNIRGNKSRENEVDGCDIEENRSIFGF